MKEITLQYIDGKFIPHSEKDRDTARSYKKYQIVKAKISGVQKLRSYQQLKLYWAIMKLVASNTDDPAWNEPEKENSRHHLTKKRHHPVFNRYHRLSCSVPGWKRTERRPGGEHPALVAVINTINRDIKRGNHENHRTITPNHCITGKACWCGNSHELVHHRHCSFAQESTRYVRYEGDMEFILPVWWDEWNDDQQESWERAREDSELAYQSLLDDGASPQQAREVLPSALKTEINVKANLREWRHIFELRCAKAAHPADPGLDVAAFEGVVGKDTGSV